MTHVYTTAERSSLYESFCGQLVQSQRQLDANPGHIMWEFAVRHYRACLQKLKQEAAA